ncbi:MAG: sigma factor-like helix-turn-helix DNA-binding protein [Pseudomonadota bacterium]
MCNKLRLSGGDTPGLHRFLMFILSDRAAVALAVSQLDQQHEPGAAKGESANVTPDMRSRLEAYKAAFEKARELQTHVRTAKADIFSENAKLSEKARALLQEYYSLPFNEKVVMALVVIEGWSVTDAAAIMTISTDAVRRHLSMARRRLNPQYWRGDFSEK